LLAKRQNWPICEDGSTSLARASVAPESAFGAVPAERRPANLITLCDGHGIDFVTVTWQILILMAVHT
jgi:hypothetical protein